MYIRVRVIPKAKKETIKKINEQTFEITVKEPAERNLANNRIKELLAIEFGLESKSIRIVSGHHSATKIFDVRIDV